MDPITVFQCQATNNILAADSAMKPGQQPQKMTTKKHVKVCFPLLQALTQALQHVFRNDEDDDVASWFTDESSSSNELLEEPAQYFHEFKHYYQNCPLYDRVPRTVYTLQPPFCSQQPHYPHPPYPYGLPQQPQLQQPVIRPRYQQVFPMRELYTIPEVSSHQGDDDDESDHDESAKESCGSALMLFTPDYYSCCSVALDMVPEHLPLFHGEYCHQECQDDDDNDELRGLEYIQDNDTDEVPHSPVSVLDNIQLMVDDDSKHNNSFIREPPPYLPNVEDIVM